MDKIEDDTDQKHVIHYSLVKRVIFQPEKKLVVRAAAGHLGLMLYKKKKFGLGYAKSYC